MIIGFSYQYKKFPSAKSTLTRKVVPCSSFFLMRKPVLRVDLSYAIPSLMHCTVAALLAFRIQQQLPAKLYCFFSSIDGLIAVCFRPIDECIISRRDNDCLQYLLEWGQCSRVVESLLAYMCGKLYTRFNPVTDSLNVRDYEAPSAVTTYT